MCHVSKLAIGVDLVNVREFVRAVEFSQGALLEYCFSKKELAIANGKPHSLASHFAAKEAVSKALGVGMLREIGWKEIELEPAGRLHRVKFFGRAAVTARSQKWSSWAISLAQGSNHAIAMIVATKNLESGFENDSKTAT